MSWGFFVIVLGSDCVGYVLVFFDLVEVYVVVDFCIIGVDYVDVCYVFFFGWDVV